MWNSSNLIFFFALIFFLIQPSQEEREKNPSRLTEKHSWHEKSKILIYICVRKKEID